MQKENRGKKLQQNMCLTFDYLVASAFLLAVTQNLTLFHVIGFLISRRLKTLDESWSRKKLNDHHLSISK